ncbi:MAG: hypothetical protein UR28_C0011G0004 [Candidatus Peregrinibacteria bacterium GW2011_GWF2_33_10]|nr:MAG: hypothetical protein UR28_C0011G0004 [Candidatus Peregrinibacteria bacterium GW2011_GWF2_33_10]OGJ44281.1 MAG: hypothetical protein A2272_05470 [Candidatus Peregrinibacteria bacterium RIFOXYA12_FULL_33_12]OGJ44656.1 MAG: hypothetical protein A2263_00910 [Candidatus Peregrinibacteria bacterium RIFOXYA2_FULL_33_21]
MNNDEKLEKMEGEQERILSFPSWFMEKIKGAVKRRTWEAGGDFNAKLRGDDHTERLEHLRKLFGNFLTFLYPNKYLAFYARLAKLLDEITSLSEGRIDLSSNSVLDFHRDPEVVVAMVKSLLKKGTSGDRSGDFRNAQGQAYEDPLDIYLSTLEVEEVMLFNNGTIANAAVLQGILSLFRNLEEAPCIIMDPRDHTSLQKPIRDSKLPDNKIITPSLADHNNIDKLKELISKHENGVLILESVYSAEGDILGDGDKQAVKELLELANQKSFIVIIDESHAIGVHNPDLMSEWGLNHLVHFKTASGSKGTGGGASFLTINGEGSDHVARIFKLIEPFTFTSTLHGSAIAHDRKVFEIMQDERGERGSQCIANAEYLRNRLKSRDFDIESKEGSAIVFIPVGFSEAAFEFTEILKKRGVIGSAFVAHATPLDKGGVRLSIPAKLTQTQLDFIFEAIMESVQEFMKTLLAKEGNTLESLRSNQHVVRFNDEAFQDPKAKVRQEPLHYVDPNFILIYERWHNKEGEESITGYQDYLRKCLGNILDIDPKNGARIHQALSAGLSKGLPGELVGAVTINVVHRIFGNQVPII